MRYIIGLSDEVSSQVSKPPPKAFARAAAAVSQAVVQCEPDQYESFKCEYNDNTIMIDSYLVFSLGLRLLFQRDLGVFNSAKNRSKLFCYQEGRMVSVSIKFHLRFHRAMSLHTPLAPFNIRL